MAILYDERTRGKKRKVKGTPNSLTRAEYEASSLEVRVSLIQQLIPIGLLMVSEELQREVEQLAGGRYKRKGSNEAPSRFGYNPGTVKLGGQQVPVKVPRVRDDRGEFQLKSYQLLHRDQCNKTLLNTILHGVSCNDYQTSITNHSGSIGKSKSAVSRRFVAASAEQLKEFGKRDLSPFDIVALFIDGKSFAGTQMVIALGITIEGKKVILGFIESGTENGRVIGHFLTSLLDRGLNVSKGILIVVDGGTGIRSAINRIFRKRV
jgi:putative transposase